MVTSIATTAANTAATATAAGGTDALAKLSGDYTMFLKLLTSQMTNQDPLNPMDTSQYTQQLVQYSQVEQSIQQSGTLKDILARLSSQDMIQASSLIGRTVSVDSASTGLSTQDPANWVWTSTKSPLNLSASITNGAGQVVDVRTLDPTAKSFTWDGTLANGSKAPDGLYTLSLKALDDIGGAIPTAIKSTGMVQAVSMDNGALMLTINGQAQAGSSVLNIKN